MAGNIHLIFSISSILLLSINALFLFGQINKLEQVFKWFSVYLALAIITQFIALGLWWQKLNNLPLLHLYTLLEFVLVSFFYKKIFHKVNGFQRYFFIILGMGTLLIIMNTVLVQPITAFNSNAKIFTQLVFIFYAVAYYFMILNDHENSNKALNMINAAILLYYSGSFFIFMFSNVLLVTIAKEIQQLIWLINAALYLLFQVLLSIGIWNRLNKQMMFSSS